MAGEPGEWKAIPLNHLHEMLIVLLVKLPPDTLLMPNGVGNLQLLTPDLDYLGYIDLLNEQVHLEGEEVHTLE